MFGHGSVELGGRNVSAHHTGITIGITDKSLGIGANENLKQSSDITFFFWSWKIEAYGLFIGERQGLIEASARRLRAWFTCRSPSGDNIVNIPG